MTKWHQRSGGKSVRGARSGRFWDRLRTGAADHRVFLILCVAGALAVGAVLSYRPGLAQAQSTGAATALESAGALRADGKLAEALKALAALDESRLSRSERLRYDAEVAATMKALRENAGALVSPEEAAESLAQLQASLAQTECELAEFHFAAGKYDEAMQAANEAASIAPNLAGSVEPLREKIVGAWYSDVTNDLVRLAEEPDSEGAAFAKMQEVCSVLDAWQAPRLAERKTETQVRWARKAVARLGDEALLNAALDILQANRPGTAGDPVWDAPVVRAAKIDERNLEALIGVWSWARTNGAAKLLHRKATGRAIDMPLDASLLQGTGADNAISTWCATWMLLDSGHGEEASLLVARLYENAPIPANYGVEAEFARLLSEWQCKRYDNAIAAADRLLTNTPGVKAAAERGAEKNAEHLRTTAALLKVRSLLNLGRAEEAQAVAVRMAADWPSDAMTSAAQAMMAHPMKGGSAR